MNKLDICILIRCYEYTSYTQQTVDSILNTAVTDYNLIVMPNKASAAINSNMLLSMATSEYIILMDDDLTFPRKGWDRQLIETLIRYQASHNVGCVAPRLITPCGKNVNDHALALPGQVMTGVKMSGALLAFRDVGIRYDETYLKTQYDDVCLLYQWMAAGYKVVVDGSVDVVHMKAISDTNSKTGRINRKYFIKKWGMDDHRMWPAREILS